MMEQEIIDLYKNPPQKYTEEHKALFMAFSAALKIFSASFLSVTSLNDFCGPFSLSSMEAESKRFKMDLNSIRFINLKASGV